MKHLLVDVDLAAERRAWAERQTARQAPGTHESSLPRGVSLEAERMVRDRRALRLFELQEMRVQRSAYEYEAVEARDTLEHLLGCLRTDDRTRLLNSFDQAGAGSATRVFRHRAIKAIRQAHGLVAPSPRIGS